MVAFIQGTWLYLSGIQADEAQLAIFDRVIEWVGMAVRRKEWQNSRMAEMTTYVLWNRGMAEW